VTVNGDDRGALGFPLRPDHAATDARHRRLGCAVLVALGVGVVVGALACGALGAVLWRP
jgi:hypothetical protein